MGFVEEKNVKTYVTKCKITNGNLLYDSGNSKTRSLYQLRGVGWGDGGREFQELGTYVYLWLINVDV